VGENWNWLCVVRETEHGSVVPSSAHNNAKQTSQIEWRGSRFDPQSHTILVHCFSQDTYVLCIGRHPKLHGARCIDSHFSLRHRSPLLTTTSYEPRQGPSDRIICLFGRGLYAHTSSTLDALIHTYLLYLLIACMGCSQNAEDTSSFIVYLLNS
jgi:hypothetical protein